MVGSPPLGLRGKRRQIASAGVRRLALPPLSALWRHRAEAMSACCGHPAWQHTATGCGAGQCDCRETPGCDHDAVERACRRCEDAARIAELERQLAEAKHEGYMETCRANVTRDGESEWKARAEAAERELDELREAARKYRAQAGPGDISGPTGAYDRAVKRLDELLARKP